MFKWVPSEIVPITLFPQEGVDSVILDHRGDDLEHFEPVLIHNHVFVMGPEKRAHLFSVVVEKFRDLVLFHYIAQLQDDWLFQEFLEKMWIITEGVLALVPRLDHRHL